jgi:4-amino-4-deoxy-L-arabinose transferase-like glycosyltransferase
MSGGPPDNLPSWGDSHHYLSVAHAVATQFRYANAWSPPADHPRFGDLGLTSYREPLYPLLLALQFKLFGDALRTTFVIQALVGTLTIPLCFGIGAMLLPPRVALLGALLESVNPYRIYYTAFVATETLASLLLLALVFCTLRVFSAITAGTPVPRRHLILLALALSAGMLTRAVFAPIALVTLTFIGAACYRTSPARAARIVGVLALLTVGGVSPWLIRNYLVWQTFVYQTNVGHNLLLGYNDLATGGYGHTRVLELDRALAPHDYNEVERDRLFKRAAFEWIRSDPARAVYLCLKKQLLFWSPVPSTVRGYAKQVGAVWGSAFLACTLIGLIRARAERLALTYVLAVIVVYALVHSVAIAITRYRIPLEGLLAVFAGCGLE